VQGQSPFVCDIEHEDVGQYLKGRIVLLTPSLLTKGIDAQSVCHLTQSWSFRIICRTGTNATKLL